MPVVELEVEAVGPRTRCCLRPVGQGGPLWYAETDLAVVRTQVRQQLFDAIPPVDSIEASLVRAERAVGEVLSSLMDAAVPHWGAGASGTTLVVLTRGPAAKALPWELLRSLPGAGFDEVEGRCAIARLGPQGGRSAPPAQPLLEVAVWCPDPTDTTCASVLSGLRATLADLGVEEVDPRSAIRSNHNRVLHVVAHGTLENGLFGVKGPAVERAVESMMGRLFPSGVPTELAAVVLDICASGTAHTPVVDRLPEALLRMGCPAVRCPDQALSAHAATAANQEFYRAIVGQKPLVEATAAARGAVRGLALGRMDARWYRLQIHVGASAPKSITAPVLRPVTPADLWPGATPGLRRVLVRAANVARDLQQAIIDSWCLACALAESPSRGLDRLRRSLPMHRQTRRTSKFWSAHCVEHGVRGLAPRVQAWRHRLGPGATPAELAEMLLADPEQPLLVRYIDIFLAANSADTIDFPTQPSGAPDRPGRPVLEVLGGPEDGRVLELVAGDRLGRAADDDSIEHQLYRSTIGCDGRLSRKHLRVVEWALHSNPYDPVLGTLRNEGRGAIEHTRAGTRAREEHPRYQVFSVGAGDVLKLTDDTWLRVWIVPEARE